MKIVFSNAFVQAPMNRDVCISLPAMFNDSNGVPGKELCLKLNESLCVVKTLMEDQLATGA